MWNVANAKRADGDLDAAVGLFTECAEIGRRRGFFIGQMVACNTLGEIWEERAALDESRRFWELALGSLLAASEIRDPQMVARL